MNKLGVALQAFAMASISGGYVPSSYYRKQTTYDRDTRHDRLSVTNPKVAQSVSAFVQGGAGNACAGVNQTITSTGTTLATMTCTGTVNFSSWGPGLVANGAGGQFAKSALSVTNGQVWVAYVAPAPAAGASGHPAFWCPQAQANCTRAQIDPGNSGGCTTPAGLSTSNFVCAASGNSTSVSNSVGTTKFHGGTSSGPGGGAAGPDGNGNNDNGTTGGSGDAGLGGAGGTGAGNGVSNALGGGGGGSNGLGGAPGGGSGAYGATGSRGQDVVHGWLCTPPADEGRIQVAGSGYGGGTISAA